MTKLGAACVAAALALSPPPALAAPLPKPLFAASEPIQVTLQGSIPALIRTRSSSPAQGILTVGSESLPVNLSARGITRRMTEICAFPPIRVEFTRPPPPTSLFAGQHRLKLVTHCNTEASFQQYVLLEYAAYRMYNLLTPASFRVRLASVDYRGPDGRPIVARLGFFLEDLKDVARRNGVQQVHAGERIPVASLSPPDAARYALFQHMINNHDWSMRAGPAGRECCHNAELIGRAQLADRSVVPVPYDFDFSGLVAPPYAGPPPELNLTDIRQRLFRGYCVHNAETLAAAAQLRAARPQILAVLGQVPGLEERTQRRAAAYLEGFFAEIATDGSVASRVLKRCVN
jgi:hypothetical protein